MVLNEPLKKWLRFNKGTGWYDARNIQIAVDDSILFIQDFDCIYYGKASNGAHCDQYAEFTHKCYPRKCNDEITYVWERIEPEGALVALRDLARLFKSRSVRRDNRQITTIYIVKRKFQLPWFPWLYKDGTEHHYACEDGTETDECFYNIEEAMFAMNDLP